MAEGERGFLTEMIQSSLEKDPIRFCMPGHKGSLLREDITETEGIDNLAQPTGALARAEEYAAQAYGAQAAYFSVNGSTAGVIALLLAAAGPGETVLIGGDCHISISSALTLGGQRPVLIPAGNTADGMPTGVQEADILTALQEHPEAKALFLTYPNYYGVGNVIPRILAETKRRGIPLILDGAHGACFGFHPLLPPTPARADGCVMSLHKTATAQNQAALICLGKDSLLEGQRVRYFLNMLQTTSPSWPLLAGCEEAIRRLVQEGEREIGRVLREISRLTQGLEDAGGIRVVQGAEGFIKDPMRLVIDVSGRGVSGKEASGWLYSRGILCEMAEGSRVVCICTAQDRAEDYQALYEALTSLPWREQGSAGGHRQERSPKIKHVYGCSPRTASYGTIKKCGIAASAGRIAAQSICIYPPGTCVVLAGDRIQPRQTALLEQALQRGDEILGLEADGKIWILGEDNDVPQRHL